MTYAQRVMAYFKETGKNPRHHPAYAAFSVFVCVGTAVLLYLNLFYAPIATSLLWSSLCAVVLAFFMVQVAYLIHSAVHASMFTKPLHWAMLGAMGDILVGLSSQHFLYNHIIGHHAFTNVVKVDPDVSEDNMPEFGVYLYGFFGTITRIIDGTELMVWKRIQNVTINPLSWRQTALVLLSKVCDISIQLMSRSGSCCCALCCRAS
jgi:fatty acid desaturase